MYTHPHFQQGNKSQGAANQVYQRRGEKSSVLQLEDNRPEAIAQRKIQEMIDSNPRVKQMKRMQGIINESSRVKQDSTIRGNGIVQMRPLQWDAFNIAGENHEESKSLRNQERDYCRTKVGPLSEYWREFEFEIDNHYADPPEYRAQTWLFFAVKKLMEALDSPGEKANLISKANEDIDNARKELKRIEVDRIFSPEVQRQIVKINNRIDKLNYSIDKLNSMLPWEAGIAKTQIEMLDFEVNNEKNDRNQKDKSERTIAMMSAFRRAPTENKIGVWKVGDAHIRAIGSEIPTTTKDEFQNDFRVWLLGKLPMKEIKQVPVKKRMS